MYLPSHVIAYRNQNRAVDHLLLWVIAYCHGWEPNTCPLEQEALSNAEWSLQTQITKIYTLFLIKLIIDEFSTFVFLALVFEIKLLHDIFLRYLLPLALPVER